MNIKHRSIVMLRTLLLLTAFALPAVPAAAISPDEVRDYGEVFVISGHAPSRDRIEVSWDIAEEYYLYNNRFLGFTARTDGVRLGTPQLPAGKVEFDDLLGEEVEKWTGRITVSIPLDSVPAGLSGFQLSVRSQGCLVDVLCYPPTEQVVLIGLPAAAESTAANADAAEEVLPAAPLAGLADSPLSGLAADPLAGLGQQDADPALPPEEAFVYESIGLDPSTALVRFTAQPGYYLYRDKFEFRVMDDSGFRITAVELPDGVIKDDPEFGEVPVIYGLVEIPVRFSRPAGPARTVSLQADFQGCRDGDICYPPQSQVVEFVMPAAATAVGGEPSDRAPVAAAGNVTPAADRPDNKAAPAPPVSEQDRLARLLTENPGRALVAFFIAGILLAFTPCVFPMVPILSGIIAGQGDRLTTMRAFWLSLVYVLAMAVTYTVAGVLAGLFGQNLQAVFQNPWILSAFVAIFIALAFSMFGFFELQLPGRLQTRLSEASGRQQGGQIGGVAIMGFLSALIVGPCVAPPLMAALIVIGASGDAVLGGSALFALSMGMGLPLILFGVSAGKMVPRAGPWMEAIKQVFGVGLLALAIWMLERILPGGIIMLLWGVLALACGVYLGALERIPEGASGWKRLWKSLGVVLLLVGALEIIGAAAGGDYWLRPLESLRGGSAAGTEADAHVEFQRIKSLDDLESAVAGANSAGKGAMLDFYADWCVECIRMERNTFPEPEIQALLGRLQPLQADVTPHDETDQALMREFGIIGPPAILFFDRNGNEMREWRLVGYFSPKEFARHLEGVLAAQ
ncbi:protein-disulfide reductase DsbD [Elongatibacter sediminis]|uniref:Thiol:disulfide interchange protein DsbD n=1 Tax=Elongatibacter sediminis TaxID=3119006 RepID=A0AAW9REX3_9GAMM